MDSTSLKLIISTSKINLSFGIILVIIMALLDINAIFAFILGNIVSTLSFIINGVIVNLALTKGKGNIFIGLSFFIRIFIVVGMAILLINNPMNLIFYIIAIVLQQLSIVFYGVTSK